MSHDQIIRAWKDPEYRETLNATALAELPPNPVGSVDLADINLGADAFLTSTNPRFCTTLETVQCTNCNDCIT
jgi:mersacidin/lichenicidin family type 2 lantibiotic